LLIAKQRAPAMSSRASSQLTQLPVQFEIIPRRGSASGWNAIGRPVALDQFKGNPQRLQADARHAVADPKAAELIAQGNDVETRENLVLRVVLEEAEQPGLITPLIDAGTRERTARSPATSRGMIRGPGKVVNRVGGRFLTAAAPSF
jgi:hypothetical protein